ncbi:hypothetical protein KAI92_02030 [Candidatus Parcubacteria bacterium]|nr:hypothetical protein [Candidatus Parcubacteria bacterium]
MDKQKQRQRIIIIAGAFIFLIIAIGLIYYFLSKKPVGHEDTRQPIEADKIVKKGIIESDSKPKEVQKPKVIKPIKKEMSERDVVQIAISFAERFGSYSNQANYDNITSLETFMSDRMRKWARNYVDEQRAKNIDTSVYYGVITKAISTDVRKFDDNIGYASILISTRRKEALVTKNNTDKAYSQSILINLIKDGKMWKIDEAYWKDKNE